MLKKLLANTRENLKFSSTKYRKKNFVKNLNNLNLTKEPLKNN